MSTAYTTGPARRAGSRSHAEMTIVTVRFPWDPACSLRTGRSLV
ncbi:hypothetical protein GPN2_23050 [Streptomyces murinus]